MDSTLLKKSRNAKKKLLRIRKRLRGVSNKPRFCVVKSNKHISAQLIDDEAGVTLLSLTTNTKEMKESGHANKTREAGIELGKRIGERAVEKGITEVIFDRGAAKYHGVMAAIADAAREAGLKF